MTEVNKKPWRYPTEDEKEVLEHVNNLTFSSSASREHFQHKGHVIIEDKVYLQYANPLSTMQALKLTE